MKIWNQLYDNFLKKDRFGTAGKDLFKVYKKYGYIPRTCLALLELPDEDVACFFSLLENEKVAVSPVRGRENSSWMVESDFCFINVRATGINDKHGSFIQAAKLLPGIRANGIHLGPFTSYDFGVIYAVKSVTTIDPILVDHNLETSGFSASQQLQAFVAAAHLLDKTVGFDLEPHMTQFSVEALQNPQLFRWIKLSPDKTSLYENAAMTTMMSPEVQENIYKEIRQLVEDSLKTSGLNSLELQNNNSREIHESTEKLYVEIIKLLISQGFWTVPSHTWGGAGIPEFSRYNHEHNYPEFTYLTASGEDQGDAALAIVTPFRFYNGLAVNRLSDKREISILDEEVLDYFCRIPDKWIFEYNFDFVRYDSVDHIFDSVLENDHNLPASDRPTPRVLEKCISHSRKNGRPWIGNMAERMGNEIQEYGSIGYDMVIGDDMLQRVDENLMHKSFHLYHQLREHNQDNQPFTIPFCTDTHDTGNPHIWGDPLLQLEGAEGMLLRQFISRFISCGKARRPKYEVMGAQDMSFGLFRANVEDVNLEWQGDDAFNRRYHWLEDVYEEHRPLLDAGEIISHHIDHKFAWWVIDSPEGILVPAVSLFNEGDSSVMKDIIIRPAVETAALENAKKYNFNRMQQGSVVSLFGEIHIPELDYLDFRLFVFETLT